MLRQICAAAVLGAAFAPIPGLAIDLTDADLLALFQNQRDAFVAAQSGGLGKTRGLTLVTLDEIEPATIAVDPTSPELAISMPDTTTIIQPAAEMGAAAVSVAQMPQQPAPDQAALIDAPPAPSAPEVFGDFAPELQVNLNIAFGFDSATLQADQAPVLAQMCRVMKASDIALFRIVGHTDAAGTAEYNQVLSQLRAQEVQRYLVNACGIEPARLQAVGLGEQFLADPVDPKAAINRRVEFQALS